MNMSARASVIENVARECLRLDAAAIIDPDVPFALMGLDSLKTIELAAALEDALGCTLPAEMLAECRDVRSLTARIQTLHSPVVVRPDDPFARMREDAILPGDVEPLGTAAAASSSLLEARTILLTGATGFLGGALLNELLARTDARVTCLVRPRGGAARDRLPRHGRVEIIDADLTRPRLGLGDADFLALARDVDAIVHAAATVNWVYSYSALRAANVIGTLELLRLASVARRVPFHFVSSVSVCYAHEGPPAADEAFDALPHLERVHLGYAQTKIIAEALVRQAGKRGLPVRIYRPALIAGDSRDGAFNRDDLITTLVRACVEMGTAPDLDWKLDCVPVDEVARAILAASADAGPVFHIGCERPRHWRELVLWMRMYGYPVRLVPYHAWLRQLNDQTRPGAPTAATHPLRGLRSFFLTRIPGARGLTMPELYEEGRRTRAGAAATHALLAREGVARTPIDADLLDTYFAAFRATGELPEPRRSGPANRRREGGRSGGAHMRGGGALQGPRTAPSFLSELLNRDIRHVDVRGSGSDHSIISELTAWRAGQSTGLFRVRADGRDLVLKIKARDEDVIDVGAALAAIVDPAVSRAYDRWRDRIGFTGGHVREIELYRQQDPRFIAHAPKLLGSRIDDDAGVWAMALEDVSGAEMIDSAVDVSMWTPARMTAAIDGLASLHAIWLDREAPLRAQPWIGHVHSARSMAEMRDLWTALASHAAPRFSSWADPGIAGIQSRLIASVDSWWRRLEEGPRTLIHHDFNSRNICLRDGRLCAYDWELATIGAPQRDLAEFLCFTMPPDVAKAGVERWLEHHRAALQRETGTSPDRASWERGFAAALGDLLLNRLPSYALIDRVRRQPFLPRIVSVWRRLYAHFPIEGAS